MFWTGAPWWRKCRSKRFAVSILIGPGKKGSVPPWLVFNPVDPSIHVNVCPSACHRSHSLDLTLWSVYHPPCYSSLLVLHAFLSFSLLHNPVQVCCPEKKTSLPAITKQGCSCFFHLLLCVLWISAFFSTMMASVRVYSFQGAASHGWKRRFLQHYFSLGCKPLWKCALITEVVYILFLPK